MTSGRGTNFKWQRTGCRVCWDGRSGWFSQKQLLECTLLPWKWSRVKRIELQPKLMSYPGLGIKLYSCDLWMLNHYKGMGISNKTYRGTCLYWHNNPILPRPLIISRHVKTRCKKIPILFSQTKPWLDEPFEYREIMSHPSSLYCRIIKEILFSGSCTHWQTHYITRERKNTVQCNTATSVCLWWMTKIYKLTLTS